MAMTAAIPITIPSMVKILRLRLFAIALKAERQFTYKFMICSAPYPQ